MESKKLIMAKYFPNVCNKEDIISLLCGLSSNWSFSDRFGIINDKASYNFDLDNVPPKLKKIDTTLHDICLKRASELISLHKKIIVLWSGGVDSTSIICSLLLAGIDPKNLIIGCTSTSILEYPYLYYLLEAQGYTIKNLKDLLCKDIIQDPNYVIVSGWCADQLFGSMTNIVFPELYNTEWKDGLKSAYQQKYPNLEKVDIDNSIIGIENYADTLGISLKTCGDVFWLSNFCFKWSLVSHDYQLTNIEMPLNSITSFFETEDFQNWSFTHYPEFREHHPIFETRYYKYPLKALIYEYTQDWDYFINKGKVPSWDVTLMDTGRNDISILTSSLERIKINNKLVTDSTSLINTWVETYVNTCKEYFNPLYTSKYNLFIDNIRYRMGKIARNSKVDTCGFIF